MRRRWPSATRGPWPCWPPGVLQPHPGRLHQPTPGRADGQPVGPALREPPGHLRSPPPPAQGAHHPPAALTAVPIDPLGRRVAALFTKAHGRVLAPGLVLLDPVIPGDLAQRSPLASVWRQLDLAL